MTKTMPKVEDLFGQGHAPAEYAAKMTGYLEKLDAVPTKSIGVQEMAGMAGGQGIDFAAAAAPKTAYEALVASVQTPAIAKALSPAAMTSIVDALEAQKAQIPDITKDLTLTSPLSTGLVAFDLEAPAKMLTPRPTPLRNRLARKKGIGLSHRFKRITGITGSGTGGVGVIRPGIADTTQTNFAPSGAGQSLYYARGPKIAYAGDDQVVPYIQFSVSDEVTWSAQYQGQGFQDIRQLSRTSLLWSSMLLEERVLLYGRGTQSGYSGVLAAPTGVAGVARTAAAGETALTGFTTSVYVRVVAENGDWGVSQASAATTAIAVSAGQVVDVTCTLPAGATGMRVFVSTGAADPGDASRWLSLQRSGYNKLTLQGALPTSGTVPTAYPLTVGGTANLTSADGGSAYANEYDGLLAYCTGANSGYTTKLNGVFSNSNPGVEYQAAFAAMFDAVKASPDRIMFNGRDRKQLSDTIKGQPNSNYAINMYQNDVSGITLGTLATTIVNEVTGDAVTLEVHPWLPQGNSLIVSDTLPLPDTQVDQVCSVFNVQDLMGVDWPVNQFAFESSSYWLGTLVCYAPAWLGSVVGIQLV